MYKGEECHDMLFNFFLSSIFEESAIFQACTNSTDLGAKFTILLKYEDRKKSIRAISEEYDGCGRKTK